MAWNEPVQAFPRTTGTEALGIDQAQRAFMARVYRWMFLGLGVTGVVALYTASSPSVLRAVLPMMWPLLIGELVLVAALSWAAPRMTGALSAGLFLLYSAVNGLTFSVIFLYYQLRLRDGDQTGPERVANLLVHRPDWGGDRRLHSTILA